jgi:FkbM family methyltransferase
MSLLKRVLVGISGNSISQKLLERNVNISQFLMGIGSGAGVDSSGEKAIFQILLKKSNPPYCIFDVGSNKGQFLDLILRSIPTNNFSIHCFEPGNTTFQVLLENTTTDDRIKLNNIGLGKESKEMLLYYDKAGSGLASLTQRRLKHFNIEQSKSEEVKIETIDNYCHQNNIEKIDLLKIDVEGHELDVLMGANHMLKQNRVNLISFEFGGCNIDTRSFFQDFYYFFKDRGMELFRITPSSYLHPITSYKEIDEQFRTTNFLAIKC